MGKSFAFAAITAFILISCEKGSGDSSRTINTDSSFPGRLRRLELFDLPANTLNRTVDYLYDSLGRMAERRENIPFTDSSGNTTDYMIIKTYHRDTDGRIIRFDDPTSSIFYLISYQGSSSRVEKLIENFDRSYTMFSYNADNRIDRLDYYERRPKETDPYWHTMYDLLYYDDKGNLTEDARFTDFDMDGVFSEGIKISYTYDDKVNTLYPTDDVIPPVNWELYSPNNEVREIHQTNGPIVRMDTINYSYIYDNKQRPIYSKGRNYAIRYYYY